MNTRPILFSAPMVRAILAGTKTQTRRAIKPQPHRDLSALHCGHYHPTVTRRGEDEPGPETFGAYSKHGEWAVRCPYGQPGDHLWVRETWSVLGVHDHVSPREMNGAYRIWYAADTSLSGCRGLTEEGKLRPSIFMPRWASRITLEVTDVRVERLQDISEADARAEGVIQLRDLGFATDTEGRHYHAADPRISYWSLWDTINGEGSAEHNRWVWVVAFKRA